MSLRRRCAAVALIVLCALGSLLRSPVSLALNPTLDISQYGHTEWTFREGFQAGAVYAIAQSSDGYLWLGTQAGLLRFDGVRAVPPPLPNGSLASTGVGSLLVARDATLWIGTLQGLLSWKEGQLTEHASIGGGRVNALFQDREGTVWAGTAMNGPGRLCAISGSRTNCYGDDGSLSGSVQSIYEDGEGRLWVATVNGLWRWRPGPPTRYLETPMRSRHTLTRDAHGSGLIAATDRLVEIDGEKISEYPVPGLPSSFYAAGILRDRDGGLWIGTTAQGLLHTYQGRTSRFSHTDGLSSDQIKVLFEDWEGSVWAGTAEGLHRFRELPVTSFSVNEGLSNDISKTVLAARDGTVWIATQDGLNRWKDGQTTVYRPREYPALPEDGVTTLYEDDRGRIWASGYGRLAVFEGEKFTAIPAVPTASNFFTTGDRHGGLWVALWFSSGHDGLAHLVDGRITEEVPADKLGRHSVTSVETDADGGIWVGMIGGGLVYVREGQVRRVPLIQRGGRIPTVTSLARDRHGVLLAATETGLSRIDRGRITTLNTTNGLPCDQVHWIIEDDLASYWLYTGCGLLRIAATELDAWIADASRKVEFTKFGSADGVRTVTAVEGCPRVTKSPDGRIWFLNGTRLSVIDPGRLAENRLPPPVRIEQLSADRKLYDAQPGLRLPPLVRDLSIDYTALSLVAPEKVMFRYRLEGQDPQWKEVANVRKVQYSNLPPGQYRFRVTASNNSGVWNSQGTALDFSIAPAYWQTNWFRALCLLLFALLLWGIYQLRLRRVARELELGLEARLTERMRIARELHDTLLQTFQAMLLRFQTIANRLPHGMEKEELQDAIEEGSAAIVGGRAAITELRATAVDAGDLEIAINSLGQQLSSLARDTASAPRFEVSVQGTSRPMQPILRDEIYRITAEAMRNAFQHSAADRIEVEVRYEDRRFVVSVRDNGKGIDPEIMATGRRSGHFGLPGMRERADALGGDFEVWTEVNSGTEVELSFPATVAYSGAQSRPRLAGWWRFPWRAKSCVRGLSTD